RLSPAQTANAFGIAGSLAGGLLAFAKAGSGGMIKRLHLGRAAESGVLAARLAQRGYEGPASVLEGRFGLLEAFCDDCDPALLTAGIGQVYEIARLCIKRYGCHVTEQATRPQAGRRGCRWRCATAAPSKARSMHFLAAPRSRSPLKGCEPSSTSSFRVDRITSRRRCSMI